MTKLCVRVCVCVCDKVVCVCDKVVCVTKLCV